MERTDSHRHLVRKKPLVGHQAGSHAIKKNIVSSQGMWTEDLDSSSEGGMPNVVTPYGVPSSLIFPHQSA